MGLETGIARVVRVSVDRLNRRYDGKLVQNGMTAHVTGVEDQFYAFQRSKELRPNEPVRIRDQSDDHPANLYPMPWTVRMNCGCRGLGSIFCRSHATWTSTVRVDGIEL